MIDHLGNGVFDLNLYLEQLLFDTLKQITASFDCSEIPFRSSGKNPVEENLSVDEIASLCCLSTSNLKKTFKTYAGCGVTEHYNRLRIIRATDYLKSGMSITDISRKMRFSSVGYFSNVFKHETGLSPLKYRADKM